ncbi:hypothetical protein GCK32_001603 [Trichostrongylus colubriformis]|uniref:Uncharacterized protein n=1 Tax=Trichostrongylus colubriformis TaxID=6319 RepID=A0AAN8J2M9_TRICO
MTADSADSSFTWSDYSISEDDAYVYCRVGASPNKGHHAEKADSSKPTRESWRSCRDSGFVDNVQPMNRSQSAVLEEQFEDHVYYNLLPYQAQKEDHDYTYPAFATESNQDVRIRKLSGLNLRRARKIFRRSDRQLSTLSVRTVVNGARPYRGCQERHTTPHQPATYKKEITPRRCVECREEELRDLGKSEGIGTECESIRKVKENEAIELYGRLIVVAIEELGAEPDGTERIAAFQRKIEKILRLRTGLDLSTTSEDFKKTAQLFEMLVERRLRAINDISPSSCQKIADKLCLTQSAARRQRTPFVHLGSIKRGIRKFFGFL